MEVIDVWWKAPYWGTFWGQFFIELIGGIFSALIFLFIVLYFFKPKIKIADFLCKVSQAGQNPYYSFKFVNLSFFSAYDIQVELYSLKKLPMGNGLHNNQYSLLTIVNGKISHVPRRQLIWKKDVANLHCVLVRTIDNLNDILNNEYHSVLLQISLKHGLTGLARVYRQEYCHENEIKKGKFRPGTKFGVI